MKDILDATIGGREVSNFPPLPMEDNDYISQMWAVFSRCYVIRYQALDILGGRNIQQFWDDSVEAYSALTGPGNPNDPVVPYSSTIARDKANAFIAALASRMYYPSVSAQNSEQTIDKTLTKLSKPMLEWANDNDGYPDESGHLKNCRLIHKMVVEGTVFVQDDVTKDGLCSQLVPNEEVFVQNFWTPSIEKQPIIIRAKLNTTWGEAEAMFGHLERFKYVSRNGGWLNQMFVQFPEMKPPMEGIIFEDQATVMWIQKKATHEQIKELKKQGRIPKWQDRAVFYNIMVNNVLMYPADNLSPYKDGYYNIKKGIFEPMAKTEFFYGNSMPNKVLEDKDWIDNWKTMMRFLAKQNALRPMQNLGGGDFDDTVYLPAQVTNVDDGIALQKIDGIGEGINQSHVQMLRLAQEEIDRGSLAPVSMGQNPEEKQTATASSIVEGNARMLMDNYTREVVFLQEARAVPLLLRLFQFLPRRDIKKIAIPDQTLRDGSRGDIEVVFKKLPKMTEDESLKLSFDIRMQEEESRKSKAPKNLYYIDTEYIKDIKFEVKSNAASATLDQEGQRAQRFERILPILLNNPDIFDRRAIGRAIIQQSEMDEDLLTKEGQQGSTGPIGAQEAQPGQTLNQAALPRPGNLRVPSL